MGKQRNGIRINDSACCADGGRPTCCDQYRLTKCQRPSCVVWPTKPCMGRDKPGSGPDTGKATTWHRWVRLALRHCAIVLCDVFTSNTNNRLTFTRQQQGRDRYLKEVREDRYVTVIGKHALTGANMITLMKHKPRYPTHNAFQWAGDKSAWHRESRANLLSHVRKR